LSAPAGARDRKNRKTNVKILVKPRRRSSDAPKRQKPKQTAAKEEHQHFIKKNKKEKLAAGAERFCRVDQACRAKKKEALRLLSTCSSSFIGFQERAERGNGKRERDGRVFLY
jgi:hypothetical protein